MPDPTSHPLPLHARAVAICIGSFWLANLLGDRIDPGFDANLWTIDLRPFPVMAVRVLIATSSLLMLWTALRPAPAKRVRRVLAGLVLLLVVVLLVNTLQYVAMLWRGTVRSDFPVPMTFLLASALITLFVGLRAPDAVRAGPHRPRTAMVLAGSMGLALILFPLAQMFCFGLTDYRRPADAIVVFGARAYADGTPSQALADRVRTACELYQEHLAYHLIFSGGPGDGPISEPHAMQTLALALGVPASAILLDEQGLSTRRTVLNTAALLQKIDPSLLDKRRPRLLAVSHFYHLPRIKLSYERMGIDTYTVPARQSRYLTQMPKLVAREVPALWAYYLDPPG